MINNVYFESAERPLRKGGFTCTSEVEEITAKATMAIAFEARTQTLIAYLALITGTPEGESVEKEILERLYA